MNPSDATRSPSPRPGGAVGRRPLPFIWICDCSGSMSGEKIQSLNFAIRNALPAMRKTAENAPGVQVLVQTLSFANFVRWEQAVATPVESLTWTDLKIEGPPLSSGTRIGEALSWVATMLPKPTTTFFPPVLALVTDGMATDDVDKGIKALMSTPAGAKAIRVAVAIGEDADFSALQRFIGNDEIQPYRARNAPELMRLIQAVSTAPLRTSSTPLMRPGGNPPRPDLRSPVTSETSIAIADLTDKVW